MIFKNKNTLILLVLVLILCDSVFSQKIPTFTIVLDAGHGGKDPGNSYHGYIEKDIALATTMKVGKLLESEKGFKVIYTRTTDVFIELVERPKIANKANAHLFVAIHCNSVKNFEPSGTETFVMGLTRSNMNLEVSKRENSVILLEDNYKETYQGFDPKKPETLIGFTIKQEDNLNNSIQLATTIQDNFTDNLNRKSRGVKQEPLWVLDAAGMPGVLIELGFLSNAEEGEFLNSEEGQSKMARQIANAIISYRKDYFGESSIASEREEAPTVSQTKKDTVEKRKEDTVKSKEIIEKKLPIIVASDPVYKVQLSAGSKKIATDPSNFKGLKKVSVHYYDNIYKYMYGETTDLEQAKQLQTEARNKGFKDAFIVLIKDDKIVKVTI